MSLILIPNQLKQEFARSLFRDIVNENDAFFVFFGHTKVWPNNDAIPSLIDARYIDADVHNNMIAIKRVEKNDVTLMVPDVTWATGITYKRYDDRVDLSSLVDINGTPMFFVYNPNNYCLYKCVNRDDYIEGTYNSSVAYPSTVIPANTTAEKFRTSDGYWWKLMYYVPSASREKFLNSDYIPVSYTASSDVFDVSGYVVSIDVKTAGTNYQIAPIVVIKGDGIGASARAFVNNYGEVTSIEVIENGHGYSFATVEVIDPSNVVTGTGCTATATLASDTIPESINTEVASEAQAKAGAIEFVDVLLGGINYTVDTIFTVVGDGSGAFVTPTILNGAVQSLAVTGGLGYTFARIETSGAGEGATFHPIISPLYGHGWNVPKELLSTTVGISVEIDSNFSDFFLGNDFRQMGLIKNVRQFGDYGKIFEEKTGDCSCVVTVLDYNAYNLDDTIVSADGGEFTVIQKIVATSTIKLLPISGQISITSVLTNQTTGAILVPLQTVVNPEINTKTGDIVYLRNTIPYFRQYQQNETVKLYLQF